MATEWTFSLDDDVAAKLIVRVQSEFFTHLVGLGRDELSRIEREFHKAAKEENADYMEHLADEGSEMLAFIEESAELAMVAMYHWVERTLKRELAALLRRKKGNHGAVARMNFPSLRDAFAAENVNLSALANADLVTTTLRLFANSWKHNAEAPSDELKDNLAISADLKGHFAEDALRTAIGAKVGALQTDGPAIVKAFVDRAATFLNDLMTRTRKRREELK